MPLIDPGGTAGAPSWASALAGGLIGALAGLLIAIFVGWIMRRNTVRKQLKDTGELMFNVWYVVTRFIAPAGVIAIFMHQLGLLQKLGWL